VKHINIIIFVIGGKASNNSCFGAAFHIMKRARVIFGMTRRKRRRKKQNYG